MQFDLVITGTDGDDTLDDKLAASGARVLINALGGNDTITCTADFVRVECGGGDDTVTGSSGYETVIKGSGGVIIDIGSNGLVLSGPGGGLFAASTAAADINETVSYGRFASDLNLGFFDDGSAEISTADKTVYDRMTGFDRYFLGDGSDTVTGKLGMAFLELRTRGGDDYIDACADQMTIRAGSGDDTVVLKGYEYDSAKISMGSGTDRVFCGTGIDTIRFNGSRAGAEEATFLFLSAFDTATDKIAVGSARMANYLMSHAQETEWHGISGLRMDGPHGAAILLEGLTRADLSETMFLV